MSEHTFPIPDDELVVAAAIESRFGRGPSGIRRDPSGDLTLIFDPDLTAPQVVALDAFVADHLAARRTRERIGLTVDEWQLVKPHIDTLRLYYAAASPTNAQTVAALKSVIAVIRALLRD